MFALCRLDIQCDTAFVTIEHREIEAVDPRHIAKLPARDITAPGQFHLNHVCAEPRQHLRAARARLHARHLQDPPTRERLAPLLPRLDLAVNESSPSGRASCTS